MYYLEKRLEVAGAHNLLLDYESKCSTIHGHNWIITVYCKTDELNQNGMVTDFSEIKKIVMRLDHQNLNELVQFNPTAENIAEYLTNTIPNAYKVSVQESEGNIATYDKGH